ncbi:MAG: DNA/RNA non-specific endonuclease [Elusimicrobia bacterium]|nr:DNA/RNA non-specific endonuclease [Elusimicrobiota bacterium]
MHRYLISALAAWLSIVLPAAASLDTSTGFPPFIDIQAPAFSRHAPELRSSSVLAQAVPGQQEADLPEPSSEDKGAAALNIALGNPTGAASDPAKETNYLISRKEYALSYNSVTHSPNWVAWHLNDTWVGDAERSNDFRPDPSLRRIGWTAVKTSDYTCSGFDRGHMCDSKDRSNTAESNSMTFLMTNIIPQAPKNNQRAWLGLENYGRKLATEDKSEVFIISGPAGRGGDGTARTNCPGGGGAVEADAIALDDGGEINVPKCTWKVLVALPEGNTSASDVTADAEVVAVIMPNSESIDPDWKKYRVSVAQVEEMLAETTPSVRHMRWPTRYEFFSAVSPRVARELKARNASGRPTRCDQ